MSCRIGHLLKRDNSENRPVYCEEVEDGALADGAQSRVESRAGPAETIQAKYSISHLRTPVALALSVVERPVFPIASELTPVERVRPTLAGPREPVPLIIGTNL